VSRDPEELLAHAGWLRRLALTLVGPAGGAEDLVQETWAAALRRPPDEDRPLRPWLAEVLRNLVRMRRRHGGVVAARRAEIERAWGGGAAPTPEELLGRLQSERLLARLVSELEEPYRQTVLLRYHEGLSAVEIARVAGIPAGTVRWRLKTGLDRLRAALDAEHAGDRRAWRRGLAPLAATAVGGGGGNGGFGFLEGIWLMTRMQKMGIALVAVALLVLGLVVVSGRSGRESPSAENAPTPTTSTSPSTVASTKTSPTTTPTTPTVSLVPAGAARVVHEPPLRNGAFGGRVINWSTGDAVGGATVTFDGEGGPVSVTTDAEGVFSMEPAQPGRYVLAVASAPGFLPFAPEWGVSPIALMARPGLRIADVTLFLRPAIDYTGTVVDPKGEPVMGASVKLLGANIGEQAQSPLKDKFTSNAAGEFVFHAPDDALLEARHPKYGLGRARLDGAVAVSHHMTIKLSAKRDETLGAAAIKGKVIDSRGAPVAGALVRAEHTDSDAEHPNAEAAAGVDGRFALTGLDKGEHLVRAICEGCSSATARAATGTEVTLTVGTGGTLAGRVIDADNGEPVAAFSVVVARAKGIAEQAVDTATVVDAEGQFAISGLEPGDYRVRAMASGRSPSESVAARVGAPDETPQEVVVRLTRGGTVYGTVTDRDSGVPLGWARITVESGAADGTSAVPMMVSTVTDDKGAYTLGGVPPGRRSVQAAAYAHHISMVSGVRVEEGGRMGPLDFKLRATKEGEQPKLELFGIGAKLSAKEDALMIEEALAGGGAEKAGLLAGDAIVKIDGELVTVIGFSDAIQRIRGPEGTFLVLGIRRGEKIFDVKTERRRIEF